MATVTVIKKWFRFVRAGYPDKKTTMEAHASDPRECYEILEDFVDDMHDQDWWLVESRIVSYSQYTVEE